MELTTVQDAFDRVAKKQKLCSSITYSIIELLGQETEKALVKLQTIANESDSSSCYPIILQLYNDLCTIARNEESEGSQKELHVGINKYAKILDKHFNPDISKACKNVEFDLCTINQIIATHFYRQGMFDVGDCFVSEARQCPDATNLKTCFLEMHGMLGCMRSRNLQPALNWASINRDKLVQSGSTLELKLHQLQFVEILQKGSVEEALQYARTHISRFSSGHMAEIQKLMACLLWKGRLNMSPYAEFLSPRHWESLAEELGHEFCRSLGQSHESPLSVVIGAGVEALPTLLKLASVMAAKKQEWQVVQQLPVPLDLRREYQFHSVFVCPVSREQGSEENPPMLMPCGHVLCKQTIVKLPKGSSRSFKCPYCPTEATVAQCRQLHI